ncbi:MAG: hypothetical protein RL007_998 [Bacteroidota bacterium]|jgi:hypothetical protein
MRNYYPKTLTIFLFLILFVNSCHETATSNKHDTVPPPPSVTNQTHVLYENSDEELDEENSQDNQNANYENGQRNSRDQNACLEGFNYCQEAANLFDDAQDESTVNDLREKVIKGVKRLQNAQQYLVACQCNDAESGIQGALSYANDALDANDFEEARDKAEDAENAADNARSDFDFCMHDI